LRIKEQETRLTLQEHDDDDDDDDELFRIHGNAVLCWRTEMTSRVKAVCP